MDLLGEVDETGIVADFHDVDDCTPEAKYVHGPVAAGSCYMCHGTHGSDNRAMLILPGNGACVACHPVIKEISDNAVSQHEPVANGVCWDCHAPHVSNDRPYLKAFYPKGLYSPYADENYALCFSCHDKNTFLFERTSEVTGFRNRDQNLHYFHVNRVEKGRVCKGCHGVHGADQDKLLLSRIPGFGEWDIPLTWVSEGERATCYVGCHQRKTYDRSQRIKNR
jgi:predicted CXXCH cytochrome family protein